jgi:hypothetical protein
MQSYGVEVSELDGRPTNLVGEWTSGIFDHCRVLKRRADGALFVLGEPYDILERVKKNSYLDAWRSIGSPVTCSEDSGWMPENTIMVLIGEPTKPNSHGRAKHREETDKRSQADHPGRVGRSDGLRRRDLSDHSEQEPDYSRHCPTLG